MRLSTLLTSLFAAWTINQAVAQDFDLPEMYQESDTLIASPNSNTRFYSTISYAEGIEDLLAYAQKAELPLEIAYAYFPRPEPAQSFWMQANTDNSIVIVNPKDTTIAGLQTNLDISVLAKQIEKYNYAIIEHTHLNTTLRGQELLDKLPSSRKVNEDEVPSILDEITNKEALAALDSNLNVTQNMLYHYTIEDAPSEIDLISGATFGILDKKLGTQIVSGIVSPSGKFFYAATPQGLESFDPKKIETLFPMITYEDVNSGTIGKETIISTPTYNIVYISNTNLSDFLTNEFTQRIKERSILQTINNQAETAKTFEKVYEPKNNVLLTLQAKLDSLEKRHQEFIDFAKEVDLIEKKQQLLSLLENRIAISSKIDSVTYIADQLNLRKRKDRQQYRTLMDMRNELYTTYDSLGTITEPLFEEIYHKNK